MARAIDAVAHVAGDAVPLTATQLFEMNKRALEARYPGRYPEMKKYRKRFKHTASPLNTKAELCAALKSLHCYLYQCAEGDVPDELLYQHCNSAATALEPLAGYDRSGKPGSIQPPEYEAAPWG